MKVEYGFVLGIYPKLKLLYINIKHSDIFVCSCESLFKFIDHFSKYIIKLISI
jgi:hypothetical protein